MSSPRITLDTILVLHALSDREMYGYEVIRATGLPSGTVYPLLARIEDAGWITARAEHIDPHQAKRPPRRYYRLTSAGAAKVEATMDKYERLRALFTEVREA